jgi:hypothetical protein
MRWKGEIRMKKKIQPENELKEEYEENLFFWCPRSSQ